ncbi:MAG: hypothetical protein V6Z82_04615 [Flavobacteriales bacterium]
MKPRIKTLYDIQIRRRVLKRQIEMTEALIGAQWQQLESKTSPSHIDLNAVPYIAKTLGLMVLEKANRLKGKRKSSRPDRRERLALISSLLIGLLTRRLSR